jgi:hypothetical protein
MASELVEAPFAQQCDMVADMPDGTSVACWLGGGHDGPHWDKPDGVTWEVVVKDVPRGE